MNMNNIIIKTENFEGPFDILLFLIENKKVNISEVILSDIIDEYLLLIENEQKQNLKVKVEFLKMATELLEIKAYKVLNIEEKNEKEEDLEKRIIEYKIIKEIANEFSKREIVSNFSYEIDGKTTKLKEKKSYTHTDLNLRKIREIFEKIIKNTNSKEKIKINFEDNFTTKDAIENIENNLIEDKEIKFSELLGSNLNKNRIVSFFLAILELFKNGEIEINILENDFIIRRGMCLNQA